MEGNRLGGSRYESPISMKFTEGVMEQIRDSEDKLILRSCWNAGVRVDREELLRALRYDREQYETGYRDGYEAGKTDGAVEAFDAIRAFIRSLPDGKEPEGEK